MRGRVLLVEPQGREVAGWPLLPSTTSLALVDELAHLQLAARRAGWSIELRDACPEVVAVLRLAGLDGVIPCRVT
jgi:hypothetical protein